jgi:exosortase
VVRARTLRTQELCSGPGRAKRAEEDTGNQPRAYRDIKNEALGWLVLAVPCAWLYAPVLSKLVLDWSHDENYSHGFLIAPIAAFFAWQRRHRLAAAPARPSWVGLAVIGVALALIIVGRLGAELFLTRVSLIVLLAGAILWLHGREHLRILAFPVLFLLLMVPLPAIVFNQIAFPLQLLASRVGAAGIQACAVPVLREGNVIVLADTSLEVAEACSGIRSLVSLLTLGILVGYFTDPRLWVRWAIALAVIPIAIAANAARVTGTGVLAHYYGAEAAHGFFHTFSGWLVFVVAFLLLAVVARVLSRIPSRAATAERIGPAVGVRP